eukprot:gi/632987642/ref/XP_007882668.1/ PREDICTED: integrin beta-7-like [Callorhinchus milii]
MEADADADADGDNPAGSLSLLFLSQNFTQAGEPESSRCDVEQNLLHRGCSEEEVVNPRGSHRVTEQSRAGGDGETVEQLTPQAVSLSLRPGQEESFTVTFRRAQGYPIDLYYLMDLSYSMKDDLENIVKLGSDLLSALRNVTTSVKIGFGSFVDKTVLPYISTTERKLRNPCPDRTEQCQPPFTFRHVLALTEDEHEFENKVSHQRISGNVDSPEGGLDAIMQAAVCVDKIGWRNVTKLLVYTSDDTFHTAGDGKLGGIYLPNDGRCHLGPRGLYQEANHHDYPSVGHLAQVLSASNIQPIFAVTKKSLPIYQSLSKLIPKSVVGELQDDSSNVIQLIMDAYNNLSSTINLEHSNLPEGVTVSYDSHCSDQSGSVRAEQGKCSNVHIKEQVSAVQPLAVRAGAVSMSRFVVVWLQINFTVHVGLTHCLDSEQSFEIRPLGFSEHLVVRVNSLCACNCGDLINQAPHCSDGNGSLTCGMCSCDEGRLGKRCECSADEDSRPLSEDCRRNKTDLVCSGRGQCVCGRCICRDKVHGDNCQCDDSSCEWHNGTMCGGKGRCVCGLCQCLPGYIGSACDCEDSTDQCFPVNGTVCSGHGECKCNQCECELGYQSPDCGHCLNCHLACHIIKDCVRCWVFGAQDEDCTQRCGHVIMETELPRKETNCSESFHGGRRVDFFLEKRKNNYHFQVYNQVGEDHDTRLITIVSVVSGIVFFGLLLLMTWRVLTEVYDRREFNRFMKERKNERWHEASNPLYKGATTTIVNPKFMAE